MSRIKYNVLLLLLFFSSYCLCGDMISTIIENVNQQNPDNLSERQVFEFNMNKKPKNFKQGNKRWFKSKKDLMKFTPQKGIELGKKIARNASIGVIWIYEPGLLLAEELVSPCFGIISYYPNVQVTVMRGERFLGIICDAREHKPINTDRFKWYIAIGNDLSFTARYYVKEGAYIKEGQELGHLSKPARSVGRVAIKSRARCSGIIVLCKTGPVNTGEEFLRISCDAASGTADVKNSLVDQTHTSLLDQSDIGKSIPKLRGLAQITPEEANYNGKQFKLPQIMNSGEASEILDDDDDDNDDDDDDDAEEEEVSKSNKNTQDSKLTEKDDNNEEKQIDNSNTLDDSVSSPNKNLDIKILQPPDVKKGNFFDFDFEEEDDGINDETEYNKFVGIDLENTQENEDEMENEKLEGERLEKEKLEKEKLEKERIEKEKLERKRLEKEKLEKEKLEKERLERLDKEKLEKTKKEKVDEKKVPANVYSSAQDPSDFHVIIENHKGPMKESSKKSDNKKSRREYNKIEPVKTGDTLDLDGLSSSIVSEAEISTLD